MSAPATTPAAAAWNVVVTLPEKGLREARRVLRKWGKLSRTRYYNVATLTVADCRRFLAEFAAAVDASPGLLNFVSHVIPADTAFDFRDAAEFEEKARSAALGWTPVVSGRSFHVRLHRRGFKGVLSTPREERFLDETLLAAAAGAGAPARITFEDPDRVIQIETIDGRAGLSLWTREDLRRLPFLGPD
jgi:tRNA(Ser,Leu) C12 N-acetylase TAN1